MKDGYSKFDNFVASSIERYFSYYLKEEVKRSVYEYDTQMKTVIGYKADRLEYVVGIYRKYFAYIERIVRSLEFEITREEFNQVIWYGCKER